MEKTVEIQLEYGRYDESLEDKGGKRFTSVGYSGKTYGGSCPCDSEEEMKRAIRSAEKTIRKNGDTPTVKDMRGKEKIKQSTLNI